MAGTGLKFQADRSAGAGWAETRGKAHSFWEGLLNIRWLEGSDASALAVAGQDGLHWRETALRMRACAAQPLESLRMFDNLPVSQEQPPVLQQVPLSSAPHRIQASAHTFLSLQKTEKSEPCFLELQAVTTIGAAFKNFRSTCLPALKSQSTLLALDIPACPSSSMPEGAAPPLSDRLYFLPRQEALACLNTFDYKTGGPSLWDPCKQPRRSSLSRTSPLPAHLAPEVAAVKGPRAQKSLAELEDAQSRLRAEVQALEQSIKERLMREQTEKRAEQEQGPPASPEDPPDSDKEEPADVTQFRLERMMAELAALHVKIMLRRKLCTSTPPPLAPSASDPVPMAPHTTPAHTLLSPTNSAPAPLQPQGSLQGLSSMGSGLPTGPHALSKKCRGVRVRWADGAAAGHESSGRQGGLGLKRQMQQMNEGNSKVARLQELESVAAQRGALGKADGKGQAQDDAGAPPPLTSSHLVAEENVKHWMGVVGNEEVWPDLGPMGIKASMLHKRPAPGSARQAAAMNLWRAAGFECGVVGGALAEGRENVAGLGTSLQPGFQIPVRRFRRSNGSAPPPTSRRYTLQEVLQHEELGRQLSWLGAELQRCKLGNLRDMKALYLLPKQELQWEGNLGLAALLEKLEREAGMVIQAPSRQVNVEVAAGADNKPPYSVCIVPMKMASGDPHRWMISSQRGLLMAPLRVVEDGIFFGECRTAMKAPEPRILRTSGAPLELYPFGVQLVMNSRTWLESSPMQLARVCALLAAGYLLYPHGSWHIRMRKAHLEEVISHSPLESMTALQQAWEAGLVFPLQQDEMSSNRPHQTPLIVRDTMKVAIQKRRAARFFITTTPTTPSQPNQQPSKLQADGESDATEPTALPGGAGEDLQIAEEAPKVPSVMHGSLAEVEQFLHILLAGAG